MKSYQVELRGTTALLMHSDNFIFSDFIKKWERDPMNAKNSTPGDDRSPAWRWIGYLYVDADKVVIPADNLMTCIREGGKRCPTGKGKTTFKAQSQSGIIVDQIAWPLCVNGKEIPYGPINDLKQELDFEEHVAKTNDMGFELFAKRAKIGNAKHIRVRPRFDNWSCAGTLTVIDPAISTEVLTNIFMLAGMYSGLGDWRPSAPKSPGAFGKFESKITCI